MKKILIFNILLLEVFAKDESITKTQEVSQIVAQAYEPNYFGMILGLFVVVGMIYLTGFLYQKLTKANYFANQDIFLNKAQVISTTSLGQGRNLHVVKIGDSAMLIGATQNNITYIKDVELCLEKGVENKND